MNLQVVFTIIIIAPTHYRQLSIGRGDKWADNGQCRGSDGEQGQQTASPAHHHQPTEP